MRNFRGSVSELTEIFQVDERRGPDDVLGHVSNLRVDIRDEDGYHRLL